MKPTELLALLQACYQERLALVERHQAVARYVGDLDVNNTYQYVIAREETHLSWLQAALEELGGVVPAAGAAPDVAEPRDQAGIIALIREDGERARAFVEAWRPRVEPVTNARHRVMLRVMLGEMLEHQRFFEQAVAGRDDLLGRRMDAAPRRGAVMASRWVGD